VNLDSFANAYLKPGTKNGRIPWRDTTALGEAMQRGELEFDHHADAAVNLKNIAVFLGDRAF
jgi:hypothetical protein